ncbi:hypothetical protein B0T16DRAFT_458765 [Cercophora newfieldiana]|uniref:RING-type domain-containing protein n=1 Tax=Cercophora newfieldiana TaxID=92897 RepID=A0AA40CRK4_9PEZI|nr:hypothetical protein B0T16DRAFT_458765 [Cercophora newfieldiana]
MDMDRSASQLELRLWRDVKAHALSSTPRPSPIIICNICRCSQIMIPGLHSDDEIAAVPQEERENCVILPCGHMFGSSCFVNLYYSITEEAGVAREEGSPPRPFAPLGCPMCRFELAFKPCGHHIRPFHLTREMRSSPVIRHFNLQQVIPKRELLTYMIANHTPLTFTEGEASAFGQPNKPDNITCGYCLNENSPGTRGNVRTVLNGWFLNVPGAREFLREANTLTMYSHLESVVRGTPWKRMVLPEVGYL